jgi:hypothetical protein
LREVRKANQWWCESEIRPVRVRVTSAERVRLERDGERTHAAGRGKELGSHFELRWALGGKTGRLARII